MDQPVESIESACVSVCIATYFQGVSACSMVLHRLALSSCNSLICIPYLTDACHVTGSVPFLSVYKLWLLCDKHISAYYPVVEPQVVYTTPLSFLYFLAPQFSFP